ncbi:hypothetical protein ABH924_002220 [Arthrobacter sp. GAS37]
MAHIGPFASEAHAAMRGLPPFNLTWLICLACVFGG